MTRRSTFTLLLFIGAAGFCHAQNGEFSSQDGFVFPGEASRPDNFPPNQPNQQRPPQQPTQRPFNPQQPQQPTQRPFRPQQPTQRPFNPQQPQQPTQRPFRPQQPTQQPFNPQQPQQPTQRPFRPQQPQTQRPTVAPQPSTTPSISDYNRCIDSCQTTSEYNPVCGSDNTVYSNPGKLSCAVNCGNPIQFVNYGQCQQQG